MSKEATTILLKCRVCGRTADVPRQKYDPITAIVCESVCNKHDDIECVETHYYGAAGEEISGDPKLREQMEGV